MFLIHGIMTGVILIVLLQLRAYRIEESRNRAYLRARSAAQQIEIEKQKSQLQGRFMEMLAHEVKTSLSVLHMVFGVSRLNPEMLEHGRRTVNNINQLIERCLQAEKFDDDEIISHFENFPPEALIEDLLSKQPDRARISVEQDGPAYSEQRLADFQISAIQLGRQCIKVFVTGKHYLAQSKVCASSASGPAARSVSRTWSSQGPLLQVSRIVTNYSGSTTAPMAPESIPARVSAFIWSPTSCDC
jgi:signal transduction histidine kinase